jgi:signal transduction histidine kinase
MLKFSLKNRISFYYIISAALLIFVAFITIYALISYTVYKKVDEQINFEVKEYIDKIEYENAFEIELIDHEEWEKSEHNEVAVDPVFLEITSTCGSIIEKSDNLKNQRLYFTKHLKSRKTNDIKLAGQLVRQIQVPLLSRNKINGYLLVAVSLEEATSILNNLMDILYILFPIVLFLLFFIARFIAGRSIKPINAIIDTSNAITKDNLQLRINLPKNKDELYLLSQTINNLLDRIENAIEREKQFTSDASHELRTPLAVIKGTLEVLIRKPRNTTEYQEKINFCISEVDRINYLVDQLLLLARFENEKQSVKLDDLVLNECISETIYRYNNKIKSKNLKVIEDYNQVFLIKTDRYLLSIIINNLISNALKYSFDGGTVLLSIEKKEGTTMLKVSDQGIGIADNELIKVFNAFYRTSNSTNHPEIKGTGLGLSIAKRLCDILNIKIEIISQENVGTTLILSIP